MEKMERFFLINVEEKKSRQTSRIRGKSLSHNYWIISILHLTIMHDNPIIYK